jgi:predicted metal-dependent hydrolase
MITITCDQPRWKNAKELKNAVREWSDRIQVTVQQIQLRPMKHKWASISTTGRLTLNTELLDLPKELGEFVIIHELVHLLVPNHGKLFKCFMSAYLPDWEEREKILQRRVN